eukprot:Nitzschia sp. Nitz4//scaffold3_size479765//100729//102786//NITZ4_000041-RA/size479765-processed-gene-0.60-mRNA-1//1//CDS//3329550581//3256//frame0
MDEDVQHLSLVDHEIREEDHVEHLNAKSANRKSFWSNFSFRNRAKAEPSEGDALLDQENVSEDERESFRDGGGIESLLEEDSDDSVQAPPGHQLLSTNSDDEFNGSDDDDSEEENQQPLDLINMNASEPILNYSHEDESSGEEESDESGSDTDEGDVAPLPRRIKMGSMQRSMSVRGYSDHGDSSDSMIDPNNRRQIHRRIEGFGSNEKEAETKTLRQRFLDFASSYRMRKMEIGDENLQRRTWLERFDNAVDSVMPADPELEGYIDAFQMRGAKPRLPVVLPTTVSETNKSTPDAWKARAVDAISHRRKALGEVDDKTYILYLECELQNKELELDSWKRRVKEMEEVVKRLKEADDDDSGSSKGASEEGESDIEWQTGVAREGTLIDIGGSSSAIPLSQTISQHEALSNEPKDPKVRKLDSKGQESVFVMAHAPDGPMGDGDFEVFKRFQYSEPKEEAPKTTADNSFPLLSSPKQHVKTLWMDMSPTVKTTDLLDNTAKNENDENDNASGTDASEGSASDEDSQGAKEGVLIDIESPDLGSAQAKNEGDENEDGSGRETDTSEESASDEDSQDGAKEGVLLDTESPDQGGTIVSADEAVLILVSKQSSSNDVSGVIARQSTGSSETEEGVHDPNVSLVPSELADLASDQIARSTAIAVVSDDENDGHEKTHGVPEGDLLDIMDS